VGDLDDRLKPRTIGHQQSTSGGATMPTGSSSSTTIQPLAQ
jgi:hypothetical protein